jgi:CheY-like chemotaxis protein
VVLLADDDPDDQLFAREAFEEAGIDVDLRFADDGSQLVDWVLRRGRRADTRRFPPPDLVLLDLRMPRKTGHEALAEIRAALPDGELPIVVLTTSVEAADARRSYELGANAHLSKPPTFSGLASLLAHVCRFWLGR